MPQKKNPDAWELIRGKTGRITAALFSLLTTLKGLRPATNAIYRRTRSLYSRRTTRRWQWWEWPGAAVAATQINVARLREAASGPALLATEAADYLVRRGVPFRQAHQLSAKLSAKVNAEANPGPRCRWPSSRHFRRSSRMITRRSDR